MRSKLLLKIEELTLHVVEQHKTIEAVQQLSEDRNPVEVLSELVNENEATCPMQNGDYAPMATITRRLP